MKLRRFNEAGIKAFREQLAVLRTNPDRDPPNDLLEHRELTEIVSPEISIALEHFQTKGDASRYLSAVLSKLVPEEVAVDAGLWTWLSCFFFDSVCPVVHGKRSVKNDYHYIFEPRNMRHFYRHLLFVSWQILRLAPRHNRLFLRSRVDVRDQLTTEVMKRLFVTRLPCVFEVFDRLYWDEHKNRPRKGATSSKPSPGNLAHRFPMRIRQLEKTFDLMSLNADQLLELLGEEFAFARRKTAKLFDDAIH
jgi:hypothetical protein